ncbi:anthranilate synthase component II [Aporhodopirellula aestuarii]|uniref:Aminodeoxychorismate/anthranilate synthase component II n=1 Tax=Aporhodopirellula aestuarii TaxID=2950107 RepID=A0ABT0U253_9BACT|nr:aminodeoxychorismate/anthranilate synthase component II [Aporhodopirellula aestuarii]MCM2370568.1 aminodeoxychorismate/anthranilate synthase component II [Aporhodopirellula aestuarii]
MILLLDNYDSFVHNVARYLRLAGKATRVIRSDAITAAQCYQMQPEAIILSPGPHRPEQAGCCLEVVKLLAGEIPILGICLGHQAIAAAYGGVVTRSPPAHAIASQIHHDATGVFAGLPNPMIVGRYHSLCVDAATLSGSLELTAWTTTHPAGSMSPDSVVMGISDHARCVHGVQFHPESLLTEHGHDLIKNFFALVDRHHERARRIRGATFGSGRPVVWMSDTMLPEVSLDNYGHVERGGETVSAETAVVAYRTAPFPTVSIAASRQLSPRRSPVADASSPQSPPANEGGR